MCTAHVEWGRAFEARIERLPPRVAVDAEGEAARVGRGGRPLVVSWELPSGRVGGMRGGAARSSPRGGRAGAARQIIMHAILRVQLQLPFCVSDRHQPCFASPQRDLCHRLHWSRTPLLPLPLALMPTIAPPHTHTRTSLARWDTSLLTSSRTASHTLPRPLSPTTTPPECTTSSIIALSSWTRRPCTCKSVWQLLAAAGWKPRSCRRRNSLPG